MPERKTIERAREDLRKGKSPSTAAGEFVREEIEHVREGKHGARSTKQAIAIGLSKARRAGVPLKPENFGKRQKRSRDAMQRAFEVGQGKVKPKRRSKKSSRATLKALKREPRAAASTGALSRQAKSTARKRKRRKPS